MTDILLQKTDAGYYDFAVENGEIVKTDAFETSIILSLGTDRRADSSEVPEIELRRGWFGNLILRELLSNPLFELGSKLWLVFQERNTTNVRNFIKAACEEALIWLVDGGYVQRIFVAVEKTSKSSVSITISLIMNNNLLITSIFEFGTFSEAA